MPRFVVLFHELPPTSERSSHWDFMLEDDGALLTWAIDQSPIVPLAAPSLRLPDHRTAYLEYEGAVSGGRGTVTRVDRGTFEWIARSNAALHVRLHGEQLRGDARLTYDPTHEQWQLVITELSETSHEP